MIPSSPEIEKSILSLCMQDPDAFLPRVQGDGVTSEHFYHPSNKMIFEVLIAERNAGRSNDLVSLTETLMKQGKLEKVTPAHLTEVFTYQPTSAFYSAHLERLKNVCAQRRAAIAREDLTLEEINQMTPEELAGKLKEMSESVLSASQSNDATKDAEQACMEFSEYIEILSKSKGEPGIQTGLYSIDSITGGMRDGELWVVSGPTGGGKSVLSLQFVAAALGVGKRVGIFSLEMGAEENIARLISCKYGVDYGKLRNPTGLVKGDLADIKKGVMELSQSSIRINDEAGLTIEKIESLASQWNDREPIDMLVIDYVQLVRTTRKGEARHEEISWITGSMKQLAKKLGVPVITGSQLNKDGDMAKARAIAQDADLVLRIENENGVYVLKNRNGQKHVSLPLVLNGPKQRFEVDLNLQQQSA